MLKKLFGKVMAVMLSSVMVLSLAACSSPAAEKAGTKASAESKTETDAPEQKGVMKAGTYTASAKGRNDILTVEVEVDEHKILSVKITDHKESDGIADPAIQKIPQAIVDGQSIAVDAVSGATITGDAIIAAVTDALGQAGADIALFQVKAAAVQKEVKNEEKSADVVIVGAGGAGLSAAIEAHKAGATVIILEKMAAPGGNTSAAAGLINAPDPERQSKQDIEDSVEKYIENTMAGGDNKNNIDLVTTMAENSLGAVHFWEELGVTWSDKISLGAGGLWPRGHSPESGRGNVLIDAAVEYVEKNHIELLTETKATELIVKDGVVTGVKAEADGFLYTITAEKGVILATGGFGANTKMVSQYDPSIDPSVNSSNMPCATGDGITMSEAVQANLIDMKYIQFYPTGVVSTGAQETDIPYTSDRIFVNKEGKRFVAEDERRDVQSQGIFAQTDGQCWVIAGTDNLKDSDTARKQAEKTVAEGKAFRADSLEELAALIKTDPAVLAKTVSDYNSFIDANMDTEFGRKLFGKKIQGAPYYAALRSPTLHHTCGGLEIDTQSRVINQSGEVIKGLYAAGEVTGGVHGSNRLGGNAITDITVFGRIAGISAAEGK